MQTAGDPLGAPVAFVARFPPQIGDDSGEIGRGEGNSCQDYSVKDLLTTRKRSFEQVKNFAEVIRYDQPGLLKSSSLWD
jgi:hypothetical protein